MFAKHLDKQGWANSVDPDQTAPKGAVWSGSTLFAILSVLLETSKDSQTDLVPSADSRRAVVSFWLKNVHITG